MESKKSLPMDESPVIGFKCLYKDFWDYHGENIASCQKEMCGERLFQRPI